MCLPYFWLPCLCISIIFSALKYWASHLEKSNFSSKMYSCIFLLVPFYNIWRQSQQDNIVLPTLAPFEAFVLPTDMLLLCIFVIFQSFASIYPHSFEQSSNSITTFIDVSVWRLTLLLLAPVYNMCRQGQPLCLVLSCHLFHLKQPSRFTWMSWGSAGC